MQNSSPFYEHLHIYKLGVLLGKKVNMGAFGITVTLCLPLNVIIVSLKQVLGLLKLS